MSRSYHIYRPLLLLFIFKYQLAVSAYFIEIKKKIISINEFKGTHTFHKARRLFILNSYTKLYNEANSSHAYWNFFSPE
jgi:hypothetical protein